MALITKPEAGADAPNSKTTVAENGSAIPNSKTTVSGAGASLPASKTTVSENSSAIPASKTTVSGANSAIPVAKTTVSAASSAIPTSKTTVGAASVPRSLTPLVNMDFAAGCYAQCGAPVLFDDLFTYSRSSSASFINRRIGCNGGYEYFLDTDYVGSVENLTTYSEQFDNAAWTNADFVISANVGKDSQEETTADKLAPNAVNAAHQVSQVPTTTDNTDVTASIEVKVDGYDFISFVVSQKDGSLLSQYFNIKSGVVGAGGQNAQIVSLNNGWYRCSLTYNTLSGATPTTVRIRVNEFDGVSTLSGDSIKGVLVSRAQVTESSKPLPYVKTITVPVTDTFTETLRVEYDPATGAELGALIEGSSTNLVFRSEEFDHASWSKVNVGAGVLPVITANYGIAPDGTTSADRVQLDAGGVTASDRSLLRQVFTSIDGSGSLWIKSLSGNANVALLKSGSEVVGDVIAVTSEWVRYSTADPAITYVGVGLKGSITDQTADLLVFGGQAEELTFASSYIRTEGSSVTRAADDITLSSVGNFNAYEYSVNVIFDFAGDSAIAAHPFSISDGTNNNRFLTKIINTTTFWLGSSGGVTYINDSGGLLQVNTLINQISTFKPDDFTGYTNSASEITDTSTIPMVSTTVIGVGNLNSSFHLFGHVSKLSIYDKALTAQEVSLL